MCKGLLIFLLFILKRPIWASIKKQHPRLVKIFCGIDPPVIQVAAPTVVTKVRRSNGSSSTSNTSNNESRSSIGSLSTSNTNTEPQSQTSNVAVKLKCKMVTRPTISSVNIINIDSHHSQMTMQTSNV
jgi:hypothetical protein